MIQLLAIVTALSSIAATTASEEEAWLGLGSPVISSDRFEVSLGVSAALLRRTETHVLRNRIVLFVPNVRAVPRTVRFEEGPIRRMTIKQADLGVALTLFPTMPTQVAVKQLSLLESPQTRILLEAPFKTLPSDESVDESWNDFGAEEDFNGWARAERFESRKSPPIFAKDPIPTAAAARSLASDQVEAPAIVDAIEKPVAARPSKTVVAKKDSEQIARVNAASIAPLLARPSRLVATIALLCLALAAAAGFGMWRRRRAGNADKAISIDVLATRSLGSKQRLVLLDTCGDRLLLAASDKEVRLLRGFAPEEGNSAQGFAKVLQGAQRSLESEEPKSDVEGVLRLRRRTGEHSSFANLVSDPNDGAAA